LEFPWKTGGKAVRACGHPPKTAAELLLRRANLRILHRTLMKIAAEAARMNRKDAKPRGIEKES
jgi:hypothetical protein